MVHGKILPNLIMPLVKKIICRNATAINIDGYEKPKSDNMIFRNLYPGSIMSKSVWNLYISIYDA